MTERHDKVAAACARARDNWDRRQKQGEWEECGDEPEDFEPDAYDKHVQACVDKGEDWR